MEHLIEREIKLAKLNAKTVGERKRLKAPHEFLVPCDIEESKDDLLVKYNVENLLPLEEINNELKIDRIKLLINVTRLAELSNHYIIDMSSENIYFDFNYFPKMLDRDVCNEDIYTDETDFIKQYKSLIGCVLQNKYNYKDYYQGGIDLLKRNKETKEFYSLESLDEIVRFLMIEYKKEEALLKQKSSIVRKEKLKKHRMIETLAVIFTILFSLIGSYFYFVSLPYKEKIMIADKHYLHKEYDKVIEDLKTIKLDHLPLETKYILAIAYQDANKELNKESKKSKSKKKTTEKELTIATNVDVFHYWIQLGRGNFKDAISTAKKIQDDDYLLNAYNNQYLTVSKDLTMDGEKKQAKLDDIESCIKELKSKMKEKVESKKK